MLSSTSGSMSSAEGRLRMVTFLGTGCSGSGSFFPPLRKQNDNTKYKSTNNYSTVQKLYITKFIKALTNSLSTFNDYIMCKGYAV